MEPDSGPAEGSPAPGEPPRRPPPPPRLRVLLPTVAVVLVLLVLMPYVYGVVEGFTGSWILGALALVPMLAAAAYLYRGVLT